MADKIKKYLKLLAGSKYIFLLNLSDKIFFFIIIVLLARNYPTGVFGQIVTLIALSIVFISVFDFGLPIYLQREIAIKRERASEIFSRIFFIASLIVILYLAAGSLTVLLVYPEISYRLFLLITLFMYSAFLAAIVNKALSGINKYREQFISFSSTHILTLLIFGAGFIYFSFTLNDFFAVLLAGTILQITVSLFYLYRNGIRLSLFYFSIAGIRKIISVSFVLGLAVVFNFLYDKIDLLLIAKMRSYDETAFYNAAYGLFKSSSLLYSFLLVSGFTRIASIGRDTEQIRVFYNEHYKPILAISILSTIILFIFAEQIINIIYTGKFENSVIILRILSAGIIAMGLNNLTGIILNGMGYFKIVMYITLYALIMNVLLNLYLLPRFGIIASAILTVITEIFIFTAEWYYLKMILNNLNIKPVKAGN